MASGLIGKVLLNQFRVEDYLGGGGMGEVFRVWDMKANSPKAIKVMRSELSDDSSMLERFRREARALKKLAHPNIIPFYGIYESGELIFMLQMFIDGPTLKEYIKSQKNARMTEGEALTVLKKVCAALGFAHNQTPDAVVHCDVKPANVMIDGGGNIYLGDFGVVRHANSTITTMAGAGTPAYMAPEQIKMEAVSSATDVYALGVMAFEMFTGQRPFLGDEKSTEHLGSDQGERLRYAHIHLPPPDPRTINPAIPPELSAVLLRALNKNPSKRQKNGQEFFDAICSAMGVTPGQVPDRLNVARMPAKQTPQIQQSQGVAPIHPISNSLKQKPAVYVIIGSVAVIGLVLALTLGGRGSGAGATVMPGTNGSSQSGSTSYALQSTDSLGSNQNVVQLPTNTEYIQPTHTFSPMSSCPDSRPQTVRVGDKVYVCTKSDRLKVRASARTGDREYFRLLKGTEFKIISGPECGESSSWWFVSVEEGTMVYYAQTNENKTLQEASTGWVREGSPPGSPSTSDFYFICRVN